MKPSARTSWPFNTFIEENHTAKSGLKERIPEGLGNDAYPFKAGNKRQVSLWETDDAKGC
ncbi:hypothetical protein PSCICJ_43660 [Pseudomonas cichorii]|nr:hypothetical protein PSCICJ_43660 [Pseudomonas cichorii]